MRCRQAVVVVSGQLDADAVGTELGDGQERLLGRSVAGGDVNLTLITVAGFAIL
jgi:hypothetical protein